MSKLKQHLFFFIEPSQDAYNISSKVGKMFLNQFCIDEDAATELSEVHHLKKWSYEFWLRKASQNTNRRKAKGNENNGFFN